MSTTMAPTTTTTTTAANTVQHAGIIRQEDELMQFEETTTIDDKAEMHTVLANAHVANELYDKALREYRQALKFYKKQQPNKTTSVVNAAATLHNMGLLYQRRFRQYPQAISCFTESIALYRQARQSAPSLQAAASRQHSSACCCLDKALAETLQTCASLHVKQKHYLQAMDCHEQVVELLLRIDEADDVVAASDNHGFQPISDLSRAKFLSTSLQKLGSLYLRQDDLEQALGAMEEAVDMYVCRLAEEEDTRPLYKALANLKVTISSIYIEQSKMDLTVESLTCAIQYQQYVYRDDHKLVQAAWNNLGLALSKCNKFDEALKAYTRLLNIRYRYCGEHSVEVADSSVTVAKLLERMQRPDEACRHYRDALLIYTPLTSSPSAMANVTEIQERIKALSASTMCTVEQGQNSLQAKKSMVEARKFYELAKSFRSKGSYQAAKDCLKECRHFLKVVNLEQGSPGANMRIRVEALYQLIVNDEAILEAGASDAADPMASPSNSFLQETADKLDNLDLSSDFVLPSSSTTSDSGGSAASDASGSDDVMIARELIRDYEMASPLAARSSTSSPLYSQEQRQQQGSSSAADIEQALDKIDKISVFGSTGPATDRSSATASTEADTASDPELTIGMLEQMEAASVTDNSIGVPFDESLGEAVDPPASNEQQDLKVVEEPAEERQASEPSIPVATAGFSDILGHATSRDTQETDSTLDFSFSRVLASTDENDSRIAELVSSGECISDNENDARSAEVGSGCEYNSDDENDANSAEPVLGGDYNPDDEIDAKSREHGSEAEYNHYVNEESSRNGLDESFRTDEEEYYSNLDPALDAGHDAVPPSPPAGSSWDEEQDLDPFLDPEKDSEEPLERDTLSSPRIGDGGDYDDENEDEIHLVQLGLDRMVHAESQISDLEDDAMSPATSIYTLESQSLLGSPSTSLTGASRRSPRKRIATAFSKSFRRSNRRESSLEMMPEDEAVTSVRFKKSPTNYQRLESEVERPYSERVKSKAPGLKASNGPIDFVRLKGNYDDESIVSQITFQVEDMKSAVSEKTNIKEDSDWWWGDVAQAVVEVTEGFLSADSIHKQRRDDDDDSGSSASDPFFDIFDEPTYYSEETRTKLTWDEETRTRLTMDDDTHTKLTLDDETHTRLTMDEETKENVGSPRSQASAKALRRQELSQIAREIDFSHLERPKSPTSRRNQQMANPRAQMQVNALEKKLSVLKAKHGEKNPKVATTLVALGMLQLELGASDVASETLLEAIKVQKEIGDPIEMARSLHVLAGIYRNLEEYNLALSCYSDAQRIERRVYGPDHPENANTLNRIGRIYLELEEFYFAMEKHQQALQVLKCCYGEDLSHPSVTQTLIHIGEVYYRERNSVETIRDNVDGYGSFLSSGMLDVIAGAHEGRGSYKLALGFLEEKLQLLQQFDSQQTDEMVSTLYNIGTLSCKAGVFMEAIGYYESALDIQQRMGCDEVQVATAKVLIATVDCHLGQFRKSLKLLGDAIETFKRHFGDESEVIADTLLRIGVAESMLNDNAAAKRHLDKALEIQVDALGPDDTATLHTRIEFATVLMNKFNLAEALEVFEDVIAKQKCIYGASHPTVADTLHKIGEVYKLQGHLAKSMMKFEDAFRMRERFLGRDHPSQATTLYQMALVNVIREKHKTALKAIVPVLHIRRESLGERHIDVALTMSTLGRCQAALGKVSESHKTFAIALPFAEEAVGANHPCIGDIHIDKAVLHLKRAQFDEAKRSIHKGLEIFKWANVAEDHPRILEATKLLAMVVRDEDLCV